jgi:hypothetical protein
MAGNWSGGGLSDNGEPISFRINVPSVQNDGRFVGTFTLFAPFTRGVEADLTGYMSTDGQVSMQWGDTRVFYGSMTGQADFGTGQIVSKLETYLGVQSYTMTTVFSREPFIDPEPGEPPTHNVFGVPTKAPVTQQLSGILLDF